MDDDELIAATARGDVDAFASLYRRHLARVVGYLLHTTGDPEVAADLAAEVFAAALASCGRYRSEHASAAPWLIGIAQNKLRESRRRGRVEDATRRRL
jgi:RNA polymerase sigma-70 factor, ECF subfamily